MEVTAAHLRMMLVHSEQRPAQPLAGGAVPATEHRLPRVADLRAHRLRSVELSDSRIEPDLLCRRRRASIRAAA